MSAPRRKRKRAVWVVETYLEQTWFPWETFVFREKALAAKRGYGASRFMRFRVRKYEAADAD